LLKPKDEEEQLTPSVITKTTPPPPQAPALPPLAPVAPPPLDPVSPPGLDLTGTPAPAPLGLPPVFGTPVTAPSPVFGTPAPSPSPDLTGTPEPAPSPDFGSPEPAPEPSGFQPGPSPVSSAPAPCSIPADVIAGLNGIEWASMSSIAEDIRSDIIGCDLRLTNLSTRAESIYTFADDKFISTDGTTEYKYSFDYHILVEKGVHWWEPIRNTFFNVFGRWDSNGLGHIIIEPYLADTEPRTVMKITRFGADGGLQGFMDNDGVFKQTFDNMYYAVWEGNNLEGSVMFGFRAHRFTLISGNLFFGPDNTSYVQVSRTNSIALPSAPAPAFDSPAPAFDSPAPSPIFDSPAPSPAFDSPAPAPPRPYFEPLFTVDAGTSTLRESGDEIVLVPSTNADNRYSLNKVNPWFGNPNFNALFPGVTLPNTNVDEIYLRIDNTYITHVIYDRGQWGNEDPFRYGFFSDLYGNSFPPSPLIVGQSTPIRKIEIGRIQRDTSIFDGFSVQYEIGPGSNYYIQVVNANNLTYTQDCVIDFYNFSNQGVWYQDIFELTGNPLPNLNDRIRYSHILLDDKYLLEIYNFLQGRANILARHVNRNRQLINNDLGNGNSPSYRIVTTSIKFGNFTGPDATDPGALPLFDKDVISHPAAHWGSGDNRNYPLTQQNGQWYLISTENWVTWNRFYYSSDVAILEMEDDQEFNLRNEFASDFEDIFINGTRTKAIRLLKAPTKQDSDKVTFWYNDTD
jgi:hypothetical protein